MLHEVKLQSFESLGLLDNLNIDQRQKLAALITMKSYDPGTTVDSSLRAHNMHSLTRTPVYTRELSALHALR